MEMQNKSLVIGRNSLVTEMLALLAGAMVAGLAAATIAGSLVVALSVMAK
jgi:hypothetical protein